MRIEYMLYIYNRQIFELDRQIKYLHQNINHNTYELSAIACFRFQVFGKRLLLFRLLDIKTKQLLETLSLQSIYILNLVSFTELRFLLRGVYRSIQFKSAKHGQRSVKYSCTFKEIWRQIAPVHFRAHYIQLLGKTKHYNKSTAQTITFYLILTNLSAYSSSLKSESGTCDNVSSSSWFNIHNRMSLNQLPNTDTAD